MRIHLLALPNAPTTKAFSLDGFAMCTMRFAEVLKRLGAHVILYGSEANDAPCAEFVSVVSRQDQIDLLGTTEYQHAMIDDKWPLWALTNPRISREIGKRKQPRDLICLIGGGSQQPAIVAHPELLWVEYSIGYTGSFAPNRVFESRAWQHCTYGFQGGDGKGAFNGDGRFFDDVIPCFFDPAEFQVSEESDDYYLYVGRLVERKGVAIACDAAKAAGVPLKLIGHGEPKLATYGEYLGALPMDERNHWMSRAKAVFCPTIYIEPFNCVAVEAQLCGTPVISTDFGGFTETVMQGVTGFRCHYMGEFVEAIEKVRTLDRRVIAQRARDLYSIDAVTPQYWAYFERLDLLWDKGWNTIAPRLSATIG